MGLVSACLVYLCVGGFIVGLSDPEKPTDDVWVFAAVCVLWLPMAFLVAGQMIAASLTRERA